MDRHGCALRVLGGMCGLPFKCSKGVRRNVCIAMMCNGCTLRLIVRRDVWIVMDVFSGC